jgi:hypothetical protein
MGLSLDIDVGSTSDRLSTASQARRKVHGVSAGYGRVVNQWEPCEVYYVELAEQSLAQSGRS